MMDIEQIKAENRIEEVIAETHPLKDERGIYFRGIEHDSLVVDVNKQAYFWNSQGHSGDVINWLEATRNWDFRAAVEWLCQRAGLPLRWDGRDAEAFKAARVRQDALTVVANYLHQKLLASPAAIAYAEGRGWDAELLGKAGCGYWDGDKQGLAAHLRLHQVDVSMDVAQACLKMPPGMFVYAHYVGGRCVYLSGRSVEGKRHYNLEAGLVGGKQPYFNHVYGGRADYAVVVEGQADALTLASWGVPAVALAGLHKIPELIKQLEKHEEVFVALDAEAAGSAAAAGVARVAQQIAAALGPTTRVVMWPLPEGREKGDANDWAVYGGGNGAACRELLADSPIFVVWLAAAAAAAEPLARAKAQKEAVQAIASLDEYVYEQRKRELAEALQVSISQLNGMVRALKKSEKASAQHKIELTLANGLYDGHLFEMIYEDDEEMGPRTGFAVRYPDGRMGVVKALETETYRILPINPFDSLIRAGVVRLPSALGHYQDDVDLQQKVQAFVHKYVDLPEHIEHMASYYIMMTWLFDAFYVLPYLRARGDSDSGKSRFTEVVGELCMRSIFVTGSTTPSPVFRTMEKWSGLTVVMDEADLPNTETSSDWIQMLNTGYKRGFSILRTSMSMGEATVEAFNAFGPKIINMRGRFPDDATESRCLTWETASGRGIRPDIPRYMDREAFLLEARTLRNMLLAYRLKTFQQIEIDYNQEATLHLPGRMVEITVPLMSISQSAEFKASVMDFVQKMSQKAVMERGSTLAAKVLEGIFRAYYLPDEKAADLPEALRLQVAHITRQANRVINLENAAAELDEEDDGDFKRNKKQLSHSYVGKILANELNLETEKAVVGTRPKVVVWDAMRLNALMIRYGMEDLVMDLAAKAAEIAAKLEDENGGVQPKKQGGFEL